jgi:hypothetical protein
MSNLTFTNPQKFINALTQKINNAKNAKNAKICEFKIINNNGNLETLSYQFEQVGGSNSALNTEKSISSDNTLSTSIFNTATFDSEVPPNNNFNNLTGGANMIHLSDYFSTTDNQSNLNMSSNNLTGGANMIHLSDFFSTTENQSVVSELHTTSKNLFGGDPINNYDKNTNKNLSNEQPINKDNDSVTSIIQNFEPVALNQQFSPTSSDMPNAPTSSDMPNAQETEKQEQSLFLKINNQNANQAGGKLSKLDLIRQKIKELETSDKNSFKRYNDNSQLGNQLGGQVGNQLRGQVGNQLGGYFGKQNENQFVSNSKFMELKQNYGINSSSSDLCD